MGRNDEPLRDIHGKLWYPRTINWENIATKRKELLMEVMKAYHEGIESPLEFNEWLRAMDKVYGWELSEELADD